MNIEKEKQEIIETLQQRDEEWLFRAIKELLEIEPEQLFSDKHKVILIEKIEEYKKNPNNVISFDEVKQIFPKEGIWQ